MSAILDEWDSRELKDIRWLAYILATVMHECAGTFQPISEYGKGKGRAYGQIENGHVFYGRGYTQLTWGYNYRKMGELLGIDLYDNPDLALDCKVATDIMFEGMIRGIFTGRKLSDYFNGTTDPVKARRIINGLDKAQLVASYYYKFHGSFS